MVAGAVAILGAVEYRGRGMAGQEMDGFAVDEDGDVPVALGGEPEDLQVTFVVPGRAIGIDWQESAC